MKYVGVREFKQDAVKYVNEGCEIVIMKRKTSVARLVPVKEKSAEMVLLEIGRVLSEAGDRRLYALHLTPHGQDTLNELKRIAEEHLKLICRALNKDERESLTELLLRISQDRGLTAGVHPGYRWLGRKVKS